MSPRLTLKALREAAAVMRRNEVPQPYYVLPAPSRGKIIWRVRMREAAAQWRRLTATPHNPA